MGVLVCADKISDGYREYKKMKKTQTKVFQAAVDLKETLNRNE